MGKKDYDIVKEYDTIRRTAAVCGKVDMCRVQTYSAYLRGARAAFETFAGRFPQIFKGKDGAYNKAVMRLATSSLRNTDLLMSGEYEIHFRNHKVDRNGKCVECEAYFSRPVIVNEEVK